MCERAHIVGATSPSASQKSLVVNDYTKQHDDDDRDDTHDKPTPTTMTAAAATLCARARSQPSS